MRAALITACAAVALAAPALAQRPTASGDSLGDLDLEQLAQVRITSVSRSPEAVGQATAAVFVVSREDIRRAGAASLPEALRLAPGLQVVRLGAQNWSITSRGFADFTTNKLLVLIDGRAVYSPLLAGVFWDAQLLPVEGGWTAVIRVPQLESDEEFALRALEEHDVIVHPGYFFDFERDGYFVVSLLTPPEALAEGISRIV